MLRQRTRPTTHVEHLVTGANTGECREALGKWLGVPAHEAGIGLRRNDETHQRMLRKCIPPGARKQGLGMLRKTMTPEVTRTLPGSNLISGTAIGIDDVIKRATRC